MTLKFVGPGEASRQPGVGRSASHPYLCADLLARQRLLPLRVRAERHVDAAQEEPQVRRAVAVEKRLELLHLRDDLRAVTLAEHVGDHANGKGHVLTHREVDAFAQSVGPVTGVVLRQVSDARALGQSVAVKGRGPRVTQLLQPWLTHALGHLARVCTRLLPGPTRSVTLGQVQRARQQPQVVRTPSVYHRPHVLQHPENQSRVLMSGFISWLLSALHARAVPPHCFTNTESEQTSAY